MLSHRTLIIARDIAEATVLRDVVDHNKARVVHYGSTATFDDTYPNAIVFNVEPNDFNDRDSFRNASRWFDEVAKPAIQGETSWL